MKLYIFYSEKDMLYKYIRNTNKWISGHFQFQIGDSFPISNVQWKMVELNFKNEAVKWKMKLSKRKQVLYSNQIFLLQRENFENNFKILNPWI